MRGKIKKEKDDGNSLIQWTWCRGGGTFYKEKEDDPTYSEAKIILSNKKKKADYDRKAEVI